MNREIDIDCSETHSTLAELVHDPLIGLVMKSDGVDGHSIELLFERIARERPNKIRRPAGACPQPEPDGNSGRDDEESFRMR